MRRISYAQYLDKVYGCFIGKAISGNRTNKVRHFHLNFSVDTETMHLDPDAFFSPLSADWASPVYEQQLVSIPQDSFSLRDFLHFRGPCCVYFSRIVVAAEDMEAFIQIGHSAPFVCT